MTIQQPSALRVTIAAVHDLGPAWAGNTVNTVIFRHHAILTLDGLQTTAFYVDDHTLRVVQRDLRTEVLRIYDLKGRFNLSDAHNCISLGHDRDGYLHLAYDHHATRLRYRRSIRPNAIGAWSEELAMTGEGETMVTYPTFILPVGPSPLMLLYRDGVHDRGSACLKSFDEGTRTWSDQATPVLSGAHDSPWTSNAYWNHPAVGRDGTLHLTYVWRTHLLGDERLINNLNVCYARSADGGASWWSSRSRPFRLPITPANSEVVHPVSPGTNLINQCGMALDSRSRPHVVFYCDDPDGVPQYHHLWQDDSGWRCNAFSDRTVAFSLRGDGTLPIPISRPEIVIDACDRAYAIYRSDQTRGRMAVTRLTNERGEAHESPQPGDTALLWWEPAGFSEPIIDRTRWRAEGILTILLQCSQQPLGDSACPDTSRRVWLVDYVLG